MKSEVSTRIGVDNKISIFLVHSIAKQAQKLDRALGNIALNDEGQGISEYLIILAVVVIAAIALATTFSDQLSSLWGSITSQLQAIS